MIMLSGSGHGFELLNCQYFDFIFNSVYTTDSTSIGLYSFNTNSDTSSFNLRLRNNVFYSAGGGTCLYFDISNTPLSVSDFNDLYSSRSNLIYYKSKSYPDLTSWLATGFDSNSVSIDHVFKSGADLHLRSSALNGKATPDYSIITDYDGQKRDSLFPDIGADEFNGTDASITKIVSPFASCKGQAPIQVRVKNSGSTKIDSLKISYAIDSSKLISAFIKTGGLLKNRDTSLTLGNANISDTVHTLKVYSSLPNNTADAFPDDDTVQTTFISAMAGSYTIGGNGADYKDFNSAVKDLIKKGVCSPVTFNVADSTYTETIVIPEIRGASATSTITFQSKSGDSSKVVLQYGSYGMPDYLVMLDGADYINFKQITFKRNQAFSYYILVLKNKATHDSFSNMVFTGDSTVSNSTTLIYSPTYGCDHISITHSVLMHAYEGIYFYAANNTRLTMGLDLRYNKFNDILFTAIDIHSVIGPTISGNFIKTNTAISCTYCTNPIRIDNNYIFSNTGGFGIKLLLCNGSIKSPGLISNNMIYLKGKQGDQIYGIYLESCHYIDATNNTINIKVTNICICNGGDYNSAIYLDGSASDVDPEAQSIRLFNNILVNNNEYGIAEKQNVISQSDFNDFFTAVAGYGVHGPLNQLSDWQASAGLDSNSLSVDPKFFNDSNLHVREPLLIGAAKPFSDVIVDIDGDKRSSSRPDIGADEFSAGYDAALSIISPIANCKGMAPVIIKLQNTGSKLLDSVKINYLIDGVRQSSRFYKLNSLKKMEDTLIYLSSIRISDTAKLIKLYCELPNNNKDINALNDTGTSNVAGAMSGKYTIGGSGANYSGFRSAVNDLVKLGVCGPVTFSIADSTYKEIVAIPEIKGASAANTITFQSKSGDSSKVILNPKYTRSDSTSTLILNGADYLIFKQITIATSYYVNASVAVMLKNGANHNQFLHNRFIGINSYSSTQPTYLVYGFSGPGSNNIFRQNRLQRANIGIYLWGWGTYKRETGNIIEHNDLDSISAYPINVRNTDSVVISYNHLTNLTAVLNSPTGQEVDGITLDHCYNKFTVENNYISLGNKSSGVGVSIANSSAVSPFSLLVANNVISAGGSSSLTYTGIEIGYSSGVGIFHNSINIYSGSSKSVCFWTSHSQGLSLYNNLFSNSALGYAININDNLPQSDYNDLFSNGKTLFYSSYFGKSYTDLASVQNAYKIELHSVSADPVFYSITDLHPRSSATDNSGTPISQVPFDYDNNIRSSIRPDIGAYEYTSRDAGISELVSPVLECSGNSALRIRLKNFGSEALDSVKITFVKDGSKIIDRFYKLNKLPYTKDTVLTIDTLNLSGHFRTLKLYTSLPNNKPDSVNTNDTVSATVAGAMGGTYTIGKTGADYSSFSVAVKDLVARGICRATVFNVSDGNYNEQITIPEIKGASAINTITFQSKSMDSSHVTLYYASQTSDGTNNYLIKLNGADYIIFKQLGFKRTGTNPYANVIVLNNGSSHDSFLNNSLAGVSIGSNSSGHSIFTSDISTGNGYNLFRNNFLKKGSSGFELYGNSLGYVPGAIIEYNKLDSTEGSAILIQNYKGAVIRYNSITNAITAGLQAISMRGDSQFQVYNNFISEPKGGTGIFLQSCWGQDSSNASVYNNMVYVGGTNTLNNYGIYISASKKLGIFYNSVNTAFGTANSAALYASDTATHSIALYNNIFSNLGLGYAINVFVNCVSSCDHNDLFTKGSYLGWSTSGNPISLSGWQKVTAFDKNSFSINPLFKADNEHIVDIGARALDSVALPLGKISFDFDGEPRNSKAPDIGADEFAARTVDAGVTLIQVPSTTCPGISDVLVKVKNFGLRSFDSVRLTLTVNAVTQFSKFYKLGPLAVGKDTLIKIGIINVTSTAKKVVVFAAMPNSLPDGSTSNDTAILNLQSQAISGTLTIGGTNSDYANFTTAVSDLKKRGICGPVVFNIADGSYNEQVSIPPIKGSSALNTITFQSLHADSSKVKLYYLSSGSSTNNFVLKFDSADHIAIRQISIERTGSGQYGRVIELAGGADSITIENNRLAGVYSSTNDLSGYRALIFSSTANNFTIIRRNFMHRSFDGIYLSPGNLALQKNTLIDHNSLDSIYNQGIYIAYVYSPILRYNILNNITGTSAVGLKISSCKAYSEINNNYINLTNGSYGLSITGYTGDSLKSGLIWNNQVIVGGNSAGTYGLYVSNCSYLKFYFNSVNVTPSYSSSAALEIPSSLTKVQFRNNVFANTGLGYSIEAAKNGIDASGKNCLFSSLIPLVRYNGSTYSNLRSWQGLGHDTGSVSVDPKFISKAVLKPQSAGLNNKALTITGIKNDFYDSIRESTPDIGAIEFIPVKKDLLIKQVVMNASSCGDSNVRIGVVIYNNGDTALKGFTLRASFNGTTNSTIKETYNKTLASDAVDTFYFAGTLNTYNGGYWNFIISNLTPDAFQDNDSIMGVISSIGIPIAKFTAADACNGDTVKFTNQSKVNSSSVKWSWDFGDGTVSALQSPRHKYSSAGIYKVTLKAEYSGGCSDTESAKIRIYAVPKSDFSATSECIGNPTFFVNKSAISQDSILLYSWDFGDSSFSGKKSPTHIYKYPGSYKVKLSTVGLGGCADSVVKTVQVFDLPVSNFSAKPVCQGEVSQFKLLNDGKDSLYCWDFGDGKKDTSVNAFHIYAAAGVYKVVLTTVNHNGCTDSVSHNVTVFELPVSNFSAATVCKGNITTFNLIHSGKDSLYSWDFGDGQRDTGVMIFHTYNKAGTYKVILTTVNQNGCSDSVKHEVKVLNKAEPDFYSHNVCQGEHSTFEQINPQKDDSARVWNFGDGFKDTGINVIHLYTKPGTYMVVLKINNANGCSDSSVRYVKIYQRPTSGFTSGDLCESSNAKFIADSTTVDSADNYTWDYGDGTRDTGSIVMHHYRSAGSYKVIEVVSTPNGCTDTTQQLIIISPKPAPAFGATTVCEGNKTKFIDSSSITTGYSIIRYVWSFGDGDSSVIRNPEHTYAAAGKYEAELRLYSNMGCDSSISKIVTVNTLPSAAFSKNVYNDSVSLVVKNPSDSALYYWNYGDNVKDTGKSVSHRYLHDSLFVITLRAFNKNGCESAFTDTVKIISLDISYYKTGDIILKVYPNPFTDAINVDYETKTTDYTEIALYDINGKKITALQQGIQPAGDHHLQLCTKDYSILPGVYFLRITRGKNVVFKKIIRI
jgi:PKD repeat protein